MISAAAGADGLQFIAFFMTKATRLAASLDTSAPGFELLVNWQWLRS
jgi:hypothetical protein